MHFGAFVDETHVIVWYDSVSNVIFAFIKLDSTMKRYYATQGIVLNNAIRTQTS